MAFEPSPSLPYVYIPERPPTDNYRTLVLLFDGTGDKGDADATNVILLRDILYGWGSNTANNKQLVYYQKGIGTSFPRFKDTNFYLPVISPLSRLGVFHINVIDAYCRLVQNYKPGDKISFFSFSRGAYTARAFAGMLNAVSLLPPSHIGKTHDAYRLYDRPLLKERYRDGPITKQAWDNLVADFVAFKEENNCSPIFVDFLGCWDTVNSVGTIRPIKLKFTANNNIVRVFRHALALDGCRVRFKPSLWESRNHKAF